MANNNENISINVEINADGQQQLNQYKNAFDGLRTSISNLSNPIAKLDDDVSKLSESLDQLNSKNDSLSGSILKIGGVYNGLKETITAVKEVMNALKVGSAALEATLTGGLSVIIAFLPEIINLVSSFFKGKDAVNIMTNNLKNMNEVMKATNSSVSEEVNKLNILYRSATDANKPAAERLKYVKQLRNEYPSLLKNMSDEDVLNGKAKKNLDELTKSIVANAKAKAALNKMAAEEAKILDADYQIEKIRNANLNEIKDKEKEIAKGPKFYKGNNPREELALYKKDSDDRAKESIDAQNKIKQDAQASIDFLVKYAGGAEAIAKTFMQDTANTAGTTIGTIKTKITTGSSGSKPQKAIQAQADQFAQRVEDTKKQYATALADFDKQLTAQQITQDAHNELSTEAEKKFLAGLQTDVGDFSAESINEVLQYQKELVKSKKLGEDQHDVDKALLPAQKLAAEKKLIEDKYNFEIQAANEAGKGTTAIRMRYAQEMAEADKKFAQERKDFELKTTQEVSNAAFSILQNSIKSQSEAKIKQLETQKTSELNNSSLTSSQKKVIEEKYAKKEAEEKTKAFKAEQKASILQAVINGALAITKATSQTGVLAPFVIPGIIAETAIQVATIAAQKAPQYARGGVHYQSDGRGALLPGYSRTDNMNAYLRSGEAVVVSEAMRDPWARNLVSAINVAYGGRDFSMPNPHRGYAIGGIFTDGGNSNRYYNAPMNDQKDLANTIAYQMINNFPPVYVDVKDINTQQSILAQTINRVNL